MTRLLLAGNDAAEGTAAMPVSSSFMRRNPPLLSLAALILTIGACSTRPAPGESGSAAPAPGPASAPTVSIVASGPVDLAVRTSPAAGSTVTGPLNQFLFDFDKPVALGEVLVTGPDGAMPMMLSSAGKQTHFEVPLPGLMAGNYTVAWRASLDGIEKRGSLAFTIK